MGYGMSIGRKRNSSSPRRRYAAIRKHNNIKQRRNSPMQSGSEMNASLLLGLTSMQSFPSLTTGQDFLHSCRHFFGLHFSALTMAILVSAASPSSFLEPPPPAFFFGGILMIAVV